MKKLFQIFTLCLFVSTVLTGRLQSQVSETNSLRTSRGTSLQKEINSQPQKEDSLPEGVTKEWLNELRDENGRRIIPEEEGDAMQRKIFNGLNSGEEFGSSVSNAGDVNGDGYDDIIIGATYYNSDIGRAYIFYGGLNMNMVADVILTGVAAEEYLGTVSAAGDVNGDGYADVIVGATGYSSSTGRAYIYYGGASMNNTADVTMTGEADHNYFGYSVSTAGDVNGDGYDDVIVGAFGYSSLTGRAYIYYGGASMNNTADVTMTGEATSNHFGYSVSTAGDVNGDGYDDVIVGAERYSYTGRAYIYYGGASMNNTADITMTGEATNNYFGNSVSGAGDVNGDGYADVIVGAFGYSSSIGRAYIYYGEASMNNIADVTITGDSTSPYLGRSVSAAGDINGDGYTDIIIGADGYNSSTGKAYILFGDASMNNTADVIFTGEDAYNYFGLSVSTAGDVNADGYSDIIVGAIGYNGGTGRVYLYDYFMKGEITHDIAMTGELANNYFGVSVSSAGDVNGDGYTDVIVGAYLYNFFTGRAYIYFGGASMNNTADVTMNGEVVVNYFGVSVSSAGDVNGDGYADVIVGAYQYNSYTGRAYIYYGGSSMNSTADVTMTGVAIDNEFGLSVSTAGDVNGDGYSDVIVGARGYSTNTGRAYIFFGAAYMDNTADITLTGETTNNYFGVSVSSAGDVNGDRYSDVIVGAKGYSSNTGRAYIFYGGASMNNFADITMTGEATADDFGISVSTAGDVNGDGYADVIVGAGGYSSSTGRAYIYYGGASMNNTADVTMTGGASFNYFGHSVSTAGDVNGDGYADVIVGAGGYSSSTGRAYIYYGGASMNNTADVTMTGEATDSYFGHSVSTAGDVNGDGYDDVIVGAERYSSNSGRAYTYYGSAISAKPILIYAKDVPNDQGGFLHLKWARSSFDVQGINLITDYVVQRSYPPSGGNFSWENISYIPATNESFYTYTAATPFDSSSLSIGTFYFRITARTSIASQYWRSGILSGHSIDNIAPLMVSPFTASSEASNVRLTWNRSSAPDLLNYVLYRSTSPTIDPDSEPVFATTSDSTYLDTSPLSGLYYYFAVAQDIHNNKSPVAVAQAPVLTLNLSMYVQGFYDASANTMVEDTVKVYLRNSTSPFSKVDSAKAKVNSSGQGTFVFSNAVNNVNYYIELDHRNSIETWSKTVQSFTGNSLTYEFTTAATQAFGDNMTQVDTSPVRYAIYGGDVNRDGTIDLSDIVNIFNDANAFLSGYVQTDVTGDDFVDLSDLTLTFNNSNAFVSVIRP